MTITSPQVWIPVPQNCFAVHLLDLQSEAVHDDRLVDAAVGIVATDMPEEVDGTVLGLNAVGVIHCAEHIQFMLRNSRIVGPAYTARGDMQDGTLSRGE